MKNSKLSRYQVKRNFSRTAEPSGDQAPVPGSGLRFVVQKHAARRLHYDLRLEYDGIFKSWAVTRGPSLDPADKRLAVEVEDHPLEYGDFEGTIPKSEYGGGTVQVWDRGYWSPENGNAGTALEKGELKFNLAGTRLKGSWVLIRMKHDRTGSKRTNWLLIKHRDDAADDAQGAAALLAADRSIASGRTMAGIEAGNGNDPMPFMLAPAPPTKPKPKSNTKKTARPMPHFIKPQLCKTVTYPPDGANWVHEIKFDGYRVQLRIEQGTAIISTRSGRDWTAKIPAIAQAASVLPDGILDGEIVALTEETKPNFAALQAALSAGKTENLIFFGFDLLFDKTADLRDLPLQQRKEKLRKILSKADISNLRYVEHFTTGGDVLLQSACRLSLEGIVSKQITAPYASDRSESWVKSKCRPGHEVVIGGWTTTNGRFRSLLAGVYNGSDLAYVGRIGTGYSEAKILQLLPKLQKRKTKSCPFVGKDAPKANANIHWIRPDLVAEIEYAGWTGSGQIRQASFKALRLDKRAPEVVAETPIAPPAAKMINPAKNGSNTVSGVILSHPDKPLWPDGGDGRPITKRDLADYLEAVGAWMLPHVAKRPCSIIRAPDGIEGSQFFQRHAMRGGSELIKQIRVSKKDKAYLQIDHVAALIAVAQIGGLEVHPWNCRPDDPETPGRLIFDLDPGPDVAFDIVVTAAREIHDVLRELGLISFCKTTGGKGLHVVTPLSARKSDAVGWAATKAFARAVCTFMARANPDRYLVNMSKKLRSGRIFLDYLRNDRMATAVAPLSPRARPGATVSMPLGWNDVRPGLNPSGFTIRTVPELLSNTKAWNEYTESERSLKAAIKKLGPAGS